ncbi:MAG: HAD-IA family hydrolase [Microlunatus sp.]|nr:HAD-IA family hydrolase [Microlunatus sp.]
MDRMISWVLFDADGVLQRSPDGWRQTLDGLLGDDPEPTLQELFTREQQESLTGGDFRDLVIDVLRRRGLDSDPDRVLDCWRLLIVDTGMIDRVRRMQQLGLRCALATNQQNVRVQHMRGMPEYAGVFDAEFYSSELGLAKPDPAFFSAIVKELDASPDQVLFVDDVAANVTAARTAGIHAELFAKDGGVPELDRILDGYGIQP